MAAFDPEKITFFAKTDARGQDVTFGIKAKDRQRHMYVVGKTGMGKSTLLENMAAQDIQNGEGMAFIDPHGSAAEVLLDYVPEHRLKDVIYFAPFDLNHPVSFNVMEDVGPDKRHLVVSGLMSTFKKIWVDAWSARMEYILTNALLVLIEYPDTTLLSVNRLFIDKNYREKVVEYCKDPAVKSFWTEEFANYTDRFAAEALPSIQNKIGQFTGNPLIRNIIGQPHSSFDIRQIMDEKKILIMNLSKGLIGETNANLLGSMLTTRIYLAAMSRANLPVEQMRQMPNFYFYVDEFQSFANATFANILSEARKYHLNLIIAHQYIAQMEEEVRDAVFGNVGTTISFRVGPFDAEILETVFTPRFLAADMVNLGFAQIYLTLMIDGIGSQPFSAVTLPPVQPPAISCKQMVIESSRQLYAKDREAVEKIVADLHTPLPGTGSGNGGGSNGGGNKQKSGNGNGQSNYSGNTNNGNNRSAKPASAAPASTRPSADPVSGGQPKPAPQPSLAELVQSVAPAAVAQSESTPHQPTPTESPAPSPSSTPEPATPAPPIALSAQSEPKTVPLKSPEREAQPAPGKPAQSSAPLPAKSATKTPDDLRAILAKMTKTSTTTHKSHNSVSVHVEKQPAAKPISKPAQPPATSAQSPSTSPVVGNLKSTLAEILEKAAPKPPQLPASDLPQQPAPEPATAASHPAPSRLNPAEIKRMLRQSDNERSPFV